MSIVIDSASKVTMHFSLELESGNLVESTFGKQPASFTIGDGSLLPGFEKPIMGLCAGDRQSFKISPVEGFGECNEQNIQMFKRSAFAKDIELAPGVVVSFSDASGAELPGVIKTLGDDEVEVDFNHPLAGKELTFTVEIINVER